MEETFDFTQGIVGIVGIDLERYWENKRDKETLNPKLEILNKSETQNPNVRNVRFRVKSLKAV